MRGLITPATRSLSLATLLCGLCSFSGCDWRPESPRSAEVRIAVTAAPSIPDPQKATTLMAQTLARHLYEGLTRVDAEGTAQPALSDHWSHTPDLRTWRFHLRPSKWSDGSPLVAGDFVRAVECAVCSTPPLEGVGSMMQLSGVQAYLEGNHEITLGCRALSADEVEFSWIQPQPEAQQLVAAPALFPRPPHSDLGNGPFLVDQWEPGSSLHLRRNDQFWNSQAVHLDAVEFIAMEELAAMEAYENSEVDWCGGPLGDLAHPGLLAHRPDFWSQPMAGTVWLRCNTLKPPLDSAAHRHRVAKAVHPQQLAQMVLHGHQRAAVELVPPCLSLGSTPTPQLDEPALSAPLELSMIIISRTQRVAIATILQQQLLQAGIHCRLVPCESKIFFERMRTGDYQLALSDWIADNLIAEEFLEPFSIATHPANRTGWSDPRIADLLGASKLSQGPARTEALSKAQAIIQEGAPVVPLYHHAAMALVRPGLAGAFMSPLGGLDLTSAYWITDAGQSAAP
ncbi:MAG: peptide ABC transporter substrate-binding protein [Chlamydiia bacterium]